MIGFAYSELEPQRRKKQASHAVTWEIPQRTERFILIKCATGAFYPCSVRGRCSHLTTLLPTIHNRWEGVNILKCLTKHLKVFLLFMHKVSLDVVDFTWITIFLMAEIIIAFLIIIFTYTLATHDAFYFLFSFSTFLGIPRCSSPLHTCTCFERHSKDFLVLEMYSFYGTF